MKTGYLYFENANEIDVNAFRLLGASTKENDKSKIGYWGSGLKYGIATLLRNNHAVYAFSGSKEVKISTRKTKMAGETFDVITINNVPTSMTTRLGKDWELWFALREIYANCLDESETKYGLMDEPVGEKGKTRIFIQLSEEVKTVLDNWEKHFCTKRKAEETYEGNKIFKKLESDKGVIYRRGFKVGEKSNLIYDYDLHDVDINESRVIKDVFNLNWELVNLWKQGASVLMVNMLFANQGSYEMDLPWEYGGSMFSNEWLEAIGDRVIVPKEVGGHYPDDVAKNALILPMKLCGQLASWFGSKIRVRGVTQGGKKRDFVELPMEHNWQVLIHVIKERLNVMGVPGIMDMEVIVGKFFDSDQLGGVDGDRIVIAEQVFFKGQRLLAETMVEEYVHIKSGHGDRTRGFQDFLISLMFTIGNYQ